MRLLRLFAIYSLIFSFNLFAATISGNVYCDTNNDGNIESSEVCIYESIWVKLHNLGTGGSRVEPVDSSGAFSFTIPATGDFELLIDNNSLNTDLTANPPAYTIFSNPESGSTTFIINTLDDEVTHDFWLTEDPVCDCKNGDGNLTKVLKGEIEINGDMSDWIEILKDPDNTICDSGTQTDYDINKTQTGEIQSTGRNLLGFTWTGVDDDNDFVYGFTRRRGSPTNIERFIFYKDDDADGLMENGDIALYAEWFGSQGRVDMYICDYVPADPAGDPMVWQEEDIGTDLLYPGDTTVPDEWEGSGDGYTIQGGLTNCRGEKEVPGLQGNGSEDGLSMEWQVRWLDVNMTAFQPITYHVSTLNTNQNNNVPPKGVDDNMGSCPLAVPVAILDINKTADKPNPRVSEDVTYTITVTNSGDPTSSVVVNDTLPSDMNYESFSGTDWTCTPSVQDVNCTYSGTLDNGESTSVYIVASVNDDTSLWGEPLINTACTNPDENGTSVCDQETVTVYTPVVSLDVNKTVSNATPEETAGIFYQIIVTNNGPDIANNIVVQDVLPSGVVYTGYDGDGWTCTVASNILDCNHTGGLGMLPTLTILVTVNDGTAGNAQINTATAHADENLTDVSDSATFTPIPNPDPASLNIEKGVNNSIPLSGENIVYGMIITNVGQQVATGVVITDILPLGVSYDGIDYNDTLIPTFTNTPEGNIILSGFDLAPGAVTVVKINVTVNADENDTVNNEACTHFAANPDVCSDVNFTVRAPDVKLSMDKTVDNENPRLDESVTYTLLVTNNGTDTAHGVTVEDTLPAEVSYISSSPDEFDDSNNLWIVGTLAPDTSREMNITVIIDNTTVGADISNLATTYADENATRVSDDANLTVYTPIVILDIYKFVDKPFPLEGENITYTIEVYNSGEDNATDITVIDTLPDDVTYLDAGGNGWTCDDSALPDLVCTNPTLNLAPGLTSFDINVTVNTGTAGSTITNTACIDDPDSEVPFCDQSSIKVNNDLDLVITKDVNNSTPSEGEIILYTITVTNNGPNHATGIVVRENVAYLDGLINISTSPTITDDMWIIENLNVGQTATLLVEATVADGANGVYENFATIITRDQTEIFPENDTASASITVTCPCDNISSDGSPAMNKTVGALMIAMSILIGLFFVRREEKYNRNER